jgi:hypothetical protein
MDEMNPDAMDLEPELHAMEERARFILETPSPIRWLALHGDRIAGETVNENMAVFLLGGDIATREEIARSAPELLEAWARAERLYLAGRNDDDVVYIDLVIDAETGAAHARDIVEMIGGKARMRSEMERDPDGLGVSDALARWDAGKDEAISASRTAWARRTLTFVADRRAKLRWGMLPTP